MTDAELKQNWADLLFGVRRSVRYHNYRRAFFDGLGSWSSFLTIISGGGVIFASIGDSSALAMLCGGIAALLGAIDLVLGFAIKARDHSDLYRRFTRLEQEIVKAGPAHTQLQLQDCQSARLEIEADEPPIFRTLDIYCHNELIQAMGYPDSEKKKLGPLQNALKQIVSI